MIKIFLDDIRPCPDRWVPARDYNEMIMLLEKHKGEVEEISLDHDLGTIRTGYDVCKWIVENEYWNMKKITIHTANPVGSKNMIQLLSRYAPENIKIEQRFANN